MEAPNPTYILNLTGLANRLMVLCSAIRLSQQKKRRQFRFIWAKNRDLGAYFTDLFEPIQTNNFCILSRKNTFLWTKIARIITSVPQHIYFYDEFYLSSDKEKTIVPQLKLIKPNSKIQSKIDEFLSKHDLSNTIGIHIRKGDKIYDIREKILNQKYINVIKLLNRKMLLCTDDMKTATKLTKMFPQIIIYNKETYASRILMDNRDVRSIEDAVVELHLLSKCKSIISTLGTFPHVAGLIGNKPVINIYQDQRIVYNAGDIINNLSSKEVVQRVLSKITPTYF